MTTLHRNTCPACGSSAIQFFLSATDHSVTREAFEIWRCSQCTLAFTQDAPLPAFLPRYYQSDAYISHTDTRKGIVNSVYHLVRRRTLEGKRKLIADTVGQSSGRLLDIGAGTGAFVSRMQQAGWEAGGLEPDAQTRERALALHGVHLRDMGAMDDLQHSYYDAVTMWHVLEHVHDLQPMLLRIKNVLRPGGYAFIAVPNYTSFDAGFYGAHWAAYDVPRHLYHFSPASFLKLISQYGFRFVAAEAMWYDSFYVSLLSERYKTGSANYLRALYVGARSNARAWKKKMLCSSVVYIMTGEDQKRTS